MTRNDFTRTVFEIRETCGLLLRMAAEPEPYAIMRHTQKIRRLIDRIEEWAGEVVRCDGR